MRSVFLYIFILISLQKAYGFEDSVLLANLKYHVYYLADDSLEGRATGSPGEKMAYKYIISQFKSIGLLPKGEDSSYLQPFDYTAGHEYGQNNHLSINGTSLKIDKDYYPLVSSSNATIRGETINVGYGITAPELKHDDYKKKKNLEGKVFVIEYSSPEGENPHSKFYNYLDLGSKIDLAVKNGAIGVIFINTRDDVNDPETGFDKNITPSSIPVVFLKSHIWNDVKKQKNLRVDLAVELNKIEKTGHNVIGFINNHKQNTVVIGAHYDHLGWGEIPGSLYRGEPKIHNGADDNASGVALTIELSKKLFISDITNNNYLIMNFSGEELGLYGSNYFVNHPTIDLSKVNYMLNFDMVGRLNPNEKNLEINGYGTSSEWTVVKNIPTDSIRIKTSEGGIGPSDQTSFYLKDIPVLHFFTGAHEDYHKPSDDAQLINYPGMISVLDLAYDLIDSLNDDGKLDFIKVKEDSSTKAPRFTVTLGVVPNYMFDGQGMKIDGISEGKPASKAGLKAGDIVIQLGEYKVKDMMSYMHALSMFEKGDSTVVKVKRNEEVLEFNVTF